MDLPQCLHDLRERLDRLAGHDAAAADHWSAERVLDAELAEREADAETDAIIALLHALNGSGALHLVEALVTSVRDRNLDAFVEVSGTLRAMEARDG